MTPLNRLDTWILMWLAAVLIITATAIAARNIRRMRKTNLYLLRKCNEARKQLAVANRKHAAEISSIKNLWHSEVDGLKSELAKKEVLLQQKWAATAGHEQAGAAITGGT